MPDGTAFKIKGHKKRTPPKQKQDPWDGIAVSARFQIIKHAAERALEEQRKRPKKDQKKLRFPSDAVVAKSNVYEGVMRTQIARNKPNFTFDPIEACSLLFKVKRGKTPFKLPQETHYLYVRYGKKLFLASIGYRGAEIIVSAHRVGRAKDCTTAEDILYKGAYIFVRGKISQKVSDQFSRGI